MSVRAQAFSESALMTNKKYKKTLLACYLGFITQSITGNFTPLLFLRFHNEYGIPMGEIALISIVFFITQILVDLFCSGFVDKIGYRRCVVTSEVLSAAGLVGLAVLPGLFKNPFAGIIISGVVYAMGSGLIEVLVSPIVEACPFENKAGVMSLLHSFYCWGVVGVVLVSTAFFAIFGIENWRILAVLWALLPLYNVYNFATCPINRLTDEGEGLGTAKLFATPVFWVFIILMIGAGAAENSMSQWVSAYAESALGFSKSVGDVMGPCLFAAAMGISRVFYGKYGSRINLTDFMLGSGVMCLVCYLLAALSPLPILGLAGCVLCGFSVGIMWPGSISLASKKIPLGGTSLFALLAMGGDLGSSIGPGVIGTVTQGADDNMKAGMLCASVFPVILIVTLCAVKIIIKKGRMTDPSAGDKK